MCKLTSQNSNDGVLHCVDGMFVEGVSDGVLSEGITTKMQMHEKLRRDRNAGLQEKGLGGRLLNEKATAN